MEKNIRRNFKNWDFDFTKEKSITSKDSFLLNIKILKKLNANYFCNKSKGWVGKTTTVNKSCSLA